MAASLEAAGMREAKPQSHLATGEITALTHWGTKAPWCYPKGPPKLPQDLSIALSSERRNRISADVCD